MINAARHRRLMLSVTQIKATHDRQHQTPQQKQHGPEATCLRSLGPGKYMH